MSQQEATSEVSERPHEVLTVVMVGTGIWREPMARLFALITGRSRRGDTELARKSSYVRLRFVFRRKPRGQPDTFLRVTRTAKSGERSIVLRVVGRLSQRRLRQLRGWADGQLRALAQLRSDPEGAAP